MEAALSTDRTASIGETELSARALDLVHLARMTLGDRSIEREVLQLFARQSTLLLDRIRASDAGAIGPLAHALKGSAKGVGVWRVAAATEAVERAVSGYPHTLAAAVASLAEAVDEANAIIADLLRTH